MSGRVISGGTGTLLPATGRRYDLVLALIPLAFVAGAMIAFFLGYDPTVGLRGGSVVALATMVYALFFVPPGRADRR